MMQATAATLIEVGYARLSLAEVSARAGLSVGAHLHHFRTRSALIAAAVDYLADRRIQAMRAELDRHRPVGLAGFLDVCWDMYSGDLFLASVELWIAARTDGELREHLVTVESKIDHEVMSVARMALRVDVVDPDSFAVIRLGMASMRGLVLRAALYPNEDVQAQWSAIKAPLLAMHR